VIRSSLGLTAVAFILLASALAALAAAPDSGTVARFLGFEDSPIEVATVTSPATALAEPATAQPEPVTTRLSRQLATFATPAALPELGRQRLAPTLPDVPDELQRAYYVSYGQEAASILHYDAFDLWQSRLEPGASFGSQPPQEAVQREVVVGAHAARWLAGASHTVWFNSNGAIVPGSELTVERASLIWRTPRAFYRLETDLPLTDALRIAATLP
jgi:hypothetical protein